MLTILLWLMAAAVCLLTAVVAAELSARWWIHHRRLYYVLPPGLRLRLHPDPETFPHLERTVRFHVNRDGERGDAPPRSTAGVYRILVAGGSQPEGYLLDQHSTWPSALQQLLDTPEHLARLNATTVHVGNIGRSGVGSEALNLILDRVLPRYRRLSAIIILIGASDVFRWLEYGAPSSAPPPVSAPDLFRCHPELTFAWRTRQLAMLELLRRMRQRWLRPEQVHGRTCRWIGKARAMRARALETRTTTPDPAPMLEHFDRHFRAAIEKARARADRIIVVRQPWFDRLRSAEEAAQMWHGGVGQIWKGEVTTFYSHDVLSRLMAGVDARASVIASELGAEQLDVMPVFERSVRTFYDFCHLTPAGSRILAAAVAAAIVRQPLSLGAFGAAVPPELEHELTEKVS